MITQQKADNILKIFYFISKLVKGAEDASKVLLGT